MINLKSIGEKKTPMWLCSWNNGTKVKIYTRNELYEQYKQTLFDIEDPFDDYVSKVRNTLKFDDIVEYLDECELDENMLNIPYTCDNFTIMLVSHDTLYYVPNEKVWK